MIPLSALYWFTNNERILLVFQAVILSAAVYPLWLLAKKLLPRMLALIIAVSYLGFVGIQSANIYDFHEMALLPFFLGFLFYFAQKRKWLQFFPTLLIALSVREHVGFLMAFLGFFIWMTQKNVRVGFLTLFLSLGWSIAAINLVMPYFGQADYSSFVSPGDTLSGAALNYASRPLSAAATFFTPFEKSATLLWSFLSFGFLPLFNISLLPMIIFQFASRFLDQLHPIRWTPYYHYSVELALILAVSTIYSAKKITEAGRRNLLVVLLIVLGMVSTNVILASPFKNLLKGQFYREEDWMRNNRLILSKVPCCDSVATQNNLVPHLSHREEIYLIQNNKDAKYVILDLHSGQDNWNFYKDNLEITKNIYRQLILSGKYRTIISSGETYLLSKTD